MTHDELLASIERMTNEEQLELIAQARERIEGRIKSKKLDLKELDEMQSALGLTNHSLETSRITYTADLNILLTHLAEMDEHEETCGEMGMGDAHKPMCVYDETDYPCDFLLTKSKRLLGVRNDPR